MKFDDAFAQYPLFLRYDESILSDNVRYVRITLDDIQTPLFVGATVGCRGDAYTGEGGLNQDEAREFHSWSAERFARAGVDYLFAGIMPNLPEILGLAQACAAVDVPYIVSVMLRPDGCIVDGTRLHDVITRVDAAAAVKPVCFSANCIHPDAVAQALAAEFNRTDVVRTRFLGLMPNASPLPQDQLDGCADIQRSSPEELAASVRGLADSMTVRIVGGCCGTDDEYLAAMAGALLGSGE